MDRSLSTIRARRDNFESLTIGQNLMDENLDNQDVAGITPVK